jgi:hypothetical protein
MAYDWYSYNTLLDKPCLICGRENRFHRVFWSPHYSCYVRQLTDENWMGQQKITLVPSHDHYACVDNLEYLEYKDRRANG